MSDREHLERCFNIPDYNPLTEYMEQALKKRIRGNFKKDSKPFKVEKIKGVEPYATEEHEAIFRQQFRTRCWSDDFYRRIVLGDWE